MIKFDPFRRLRRRSSIVPSPLREQDTDESLPERHRPRIVHVRDSGDHNPKLSRATSDRIKETTRSADKPERLSSKAFKSGVACVTYPNDAVDTLQPTVKPTLIRRVTSKLNIRIPLRSNSELRSRPSTRTLPTNLGPHLPKPTIAPPQHSSSFVSKQHREAALRERGLLPPRKDLSEQEREADGRLGCAPSLSPPSGKSSEAEQFKQSWLALNKISEASESEGISHANVLPRSSEGNPACRHSCGSVPPLSSSSCLEILHEESSDHGPITPPLFQTPVPVIVSSSLDAPPSPVHMESPVSYTFASRYPGSTVESQSQSSYPSVPEKDFVHSRARRCTSDAPEHKVVGSKLSRLGSQSILNLRRTVVGGLWVPSSSTLSTSDRSSSYAPRTAIDPTMHSLGSILRETRDIEDVESRRLSELAFLN